MNTGMYRKLLKAALPGLALAIGISMADPAEAGQLVVISSTIDALKPGVMLDGAKPLNLPAGASVTVIRGDGVLMTLTGPHQGTPNSAASDDPGLLSKLARVLTSSDQSRTSLGAVRSIGGGKPLVGKPWTVDLNRSGDVCASTTEGIGLMRPKAATGRQVVLKRMESGDKAEVTWPADREVTAWPEPVAVADGAIYLARVPDTASGARLVMHVMPAGLDSPGRQAAWMADQGCTQQARALLVHAR